MWRQCYGKQLHNPLVYTASQINLAGEVAEWCRTFTAVDCGEAMKIEGHKGNLWSIEYLNE
jgi:hypothetical protein